MKTMNPTVNDLTMLLDFMIDRHEHRNDVCLYTEDFQYTDWKATLPNNMSLEMYYDIMELAETLFTKLCYFAEDITNQFPEQQLFIEYHNYVFRFSMLSGQGTDFFISIVSNDEAKIVLKFSEVLELANMTTYEQAHYYANVCLNDYVTDQNLAKVMFCLGRSCVCSTFVDKLNKDNFDKVIRLTTVSC